MKTLRTLALVFAAVAIAAAWGAGSASATRMCKTDTTPCSEAYGVGTVIKGQLLAGTKFKFETGAFTAECAKSNINSEITNAGGSEKVVESKITTFTLSECGSCTVSVTSLGHDVDHPLAGTMNTTTTWVESEAKVSCMGIECVYGSTGSVDLGTWTKRKLWWDTFHWNPALPKKSGSFLCASSGKGSAEYEVTAPEPIYWSPS